MTDEEKKNVDLLSGALASSSLASAPSGAPASPSSSSPPTPPPRRGTTIEDLPHDLIVSIFLFTAVGIVAPGGAMDPTWIRETMPRVCRAWREVYHSRQASPLHSTLTIDPRIHRARNVLLWARRHARDVQALIVYEVPLGVRLRADYTEASFTELVSVLGRASLKTLMIKPGVGSLMRDRFWGTLRDVVFPRNTIENIAIEEIRVALPEIFAAALGKLSNLNTLLLVCEPEHPMEAMMNARMGIKWGLPNFPSSLVAQTTKLRRLRLYNHRGVTSVPKEISKLNRLQELTVNRCALRSLPAELGNLKELLVLNVEGNKGLGGGDAEASFPAAALRGLSSLRELRLQACDLRSVPSFVGQLKSLKDLYLSDNEDLGRVGRAPGFGFAPSKFPEKLNALTSLGLRACGLTSVPAVVLNSMPSIKQLGLAQNKLKQLPKDLGKRLTSLEEIYLQSNLFAAFPVAALSGAENLKAIDFRQNDKLQIDRPLDALLSNHPKLVLVKMWRQSGGWTRGSQTHLASFATKLTARNPVAARELLAPPPDYLAAMAGVGGGGAGFPSGFSF